MVTFHVSHTQQVMSVKEHSLALCYCLWISPFDLPLNHLNIWKDLMLWVVGARNTSSSADRMHQMALHTLTNPSVAKDLLESWLTKNNFPIVPSFCVFVFTKTIFLSVKSDPFPLSMWDVHLEHSAGLRPWTRAASRPAVRNEWPTCPKRTREKKRCSLLSSPAGLLGLLG